MRKKRVKRLTEECLTFSLDFLIVFFRLLLQNVQYANFDFKKTQNIFLAFMIVKDSLET